MTAPDREAGAPVRTRHICRIGKNTLSQALITATLLSASAALHAAQDYIVAPSGGDITGAQLSQELAQAQGNLTLNSSDGKTAGTGDIYIRDVVSWSNNVTLTLKASNSIHIMGNISASGATAGLIISPNTANGNESPSGKGSYNLVASTITLSGASPTLTIGGTGYTVINSLGAASDATTPPTPLTLQGLAASANHRGYFALGGDIDASATSSWNSNSGFTPIDSLSNEFTGQFDGLGHKISHLTIKLPSGSYVGLFGATGTNAMIRNVELTSPTIAGSNSVGALVGYNSGGTILQSEATSASVTGQTTTGALIGDNGGTVRLSFATGQVLLPASTTPSSLGGLTGTNAGSLQNCYAQVSVSGGSGTQIGGLAGLNSGTGSITDCYAAGSVSGAAGKTGGLVGVNKASASAVTSSYWDTQVSGQASSAAGTGLTTQQMMTQSSFSGWDFTDIWSITGQNYPTFRVPPPAIHIIYTLSDLQGMQNDLTAAYQLGGNIDASASATSGFTPVGSQSTPFTGSLDGKGYAINNITINQPSSTNVGLFGYTGSGATIKNVGMQAVVITGQSNVGALAGSNQGTIQNSYADAVNITASSTGSGANGAGGLVGSNTGSISGSSSTGTITGVQNGGGLVSINQGQISGSYSLVGIGNATGAVGGLVGQNLSGGTISSSYASGQLADVGSTDTVGGLVGTNAGSISFSNALGLVNCGSGSTCGGLIGTSNSGSIANSYATGGVNGGGGTVGGLVGSNAGTISTSYATGTLQGSSGATLGGLVGNNQNSTGGLSNDYWNSSLTATGVGAGTATGATGLAAAQMLVPSSFSGFTWITTAGAQGWLALNADGSLPAGSSTSAAATSPMLATEYSTSIGNAHQLQLMQLNLGASYSIVAPIDASATSNGTDVWAYYTSLASPSGFVPVGHQSAPFTGVLDGGKYPITALIILRSDDNVGLFGYTSNATLRNVTIKNAGIIGQDDAGALAGSFIAGSATNIYVSSNVSGSSTFNFSTGTNIGAMIGNNTGAISNSYSTGLAYGGDNVGGLAGANFGTISNSASGANANARDLSSGGLVGLNIGTIQNTYATGDVIGQQSGGLVGEQDSGGSIKNSYARNSLLYNAKSPRWSGGLLNVNAGTVNNSYWDTAIGVTTSAGGTALGDLQMQQQSSFSGWDFTNTWEMNTYPTLRNLPQP